MNNAPDPLDTARAVVQAMYPRDRAAQLLGIRIVDVGPGRARAQMKVRPDMVNGHDICHGGLIFTLADAAFAYACNSHNHNTVASGASIDFVAPAHLGETLVAVGVEQALSGRTGVYDIEVTGEGGRRVALFRGRSYRVKGEVTPAPSAAEEAQ
ncbi:MAG: hydroxyphenylacetyl-CoA thioesterase PaaI [Betaproteobacteria bacterium]|nr:hydroxyphenylacetyl-CoA thioesterase PaaI [Betaproteobacteria bacterium]